MKLFIFTGSNNHDTTKGVLKLQSCVVENYHILTSTTPTAVKPRVEVYFPGFIESEVIPQFRSQDGAIFYDPNAVSEKLARQCNELATAHPNSPIWYIDNGSSNIYRSIIRRDNVSVMVVEIESAQHMANVIVTKFLNRQAATAPPVIEERLPLDKLCSTPAG